MATVTAPDSTDAHATGYTADPRQVWRPSLQGTVARIAVLALILFFVLALPHILDPVLVPILVVAFTYGMIALSLNVLMGYTGQVSFGHAAFVGVGAFTGAILLSDAGLPYGVALVAAALIGALAALILGGIALRVRGLYLAIVTIAYGIFAQEVLFNVRSLTGGGAGKLAPRPSFAADESVILGMSFSSDEKFVYFVFAMLLLVWAFDWRLTASKAGRAIQALRDDERVAASWGINVTGYKLLAFVISGAIAGLAGILFAGKEQIATPQDFRFGLSLTFVLMTVVGGLTSRPGVVQGGIVFAALPTLLDRAHENWAACEAWLQPFGWFPFPGPRIFQLLIGAGLLAGGLHVARGALQSEQPAGARAGRGVGALVLGGAGVYMLGAGLFTYFCIFDVFTAVWEPLIGALLLLLTLILFPGGIAEQQEDLLRWLSFKPFHAPKNVTVGGGSGGGGGAHGRP